MSETEDDGKEGYEIDDDVGANGNIDDDGSLPANHYQRRRSRAVLYQLSGHYRRSINMKSKLKLNNVCSPKVPLVLFILYIVILSYYIQ